MPVIPDVDKLEMVLREAREDFIEIRKRMADADFNSKAYDAMRQRVVVACRALEAAMNGEDAP